MVYVWAPQFYFGYWIRTVRLRNASETFSFKIIEELIVLAMH